ncbi:cupin domain-containing protein [Amnibacterium sp. CER49]|uniref:cupin domain-containing protein n=1 Tax=Amnibacterium sp. CER49 TaxID=3039161 RepID=UPI00244CF201|nr:cupin domain-containing protein [Amnibacterium sp. CER49]MDH2443219.1 cupin domain-containing protein [Amnibacterium sp. CER49]
MVAVGQEFSNTRSGERFVWRATRESTAGAYCEFDLHLAAGAKVAAAHVHPHQTETFTVVAGRIRLRAGHEARELEAGGVGTIPPGTPHAWGNATGSPSHVVVRLAPALDIEDFFEAFCAVAAAGKAGRSGLPRNPLRLAVLLDAYRAELDFPSRGLRLVLSPVLALLAVLGRAVGLRPSPVPARAPVPLRRGAARRQRGR